MIKYTLFIGANLIAGLVLFYAMQLDEINNNEIDREIKVYTTTGRVT